MRDTTLGFLLTLYVNKIKVYILDVLPYRRFAAAYTNVIINEGLTRANCQYVLTVVDGAAGDWEDGTIHPHQ